MLLFSCLTRALHALCRVRAAFASPLMADSTADKGASAICWMLSHLTTLLLVLKIRLVSQPPYAPGYLPLEIVRLQCLDSCHRIFNGDSSHCQEP